jgi:DeoR/GlpR family transcriptional regulator of sugar metabolism
LTNRAKYGRILNVNQHPPPTLTAERSAAIARIVAQKGAARVAELIDRFDVHPSTIRRDLKTLEERGEIRRVHGGAVATSRTATDSISTSADTPKDRIGRAAAEMIANGETVFLGPGQLTLAVAHSLTAHSKLTIVTNSLEVAHWVAVHTSHTLIVTGGQAEGGDLGLVGQLTRSAFSSLRADHVMLELGGISAVGGLTEDSLPQAEIARMLLQIGTQVTILVPARRVGRVAAAFIGPTSDADVVVTAREAPSPFLWDLSESGMRVVLA